MTTAPPYNPLDKHNLAASVVDALLQRTPAALPPPKFRGAGIYAIYYAGFFEPYQIVAEANRHENCSIPVYVGKATPLGVRKGVLRLRAITGMVLANRLNQHARAIDQVNNLNLGDFSCRHLVVDDMWIPLAESALIERFQPIWNTRIDGFGNHETESSRRNQARSQWDVLHPGRPWATKLTANVTPDDVVALIAG